MYGKPTQHCKANSPNKHFLKKGKSRIYISSVSAQRTSTRNIPDRNQASYFKTEESGITLAFE